MVLKELILNFEGCFYWFFTISTLRGCGGLERTDFEQFLL